MADEVVVYISAHEDMESERDLLARSAVEAPVNLAWRIVQSPVRGRPPDPQAILQAGVHILLLGEDIRAPIGYEWVLSRRSGRYPTPFLKQGILRTPAAEAFVRYIAETTPWRTFKRPAELRNQFQLLLANHFLSHAAYYAFSSAELERVNAWRAELEQARLKDVPEERGGASQSSVILSVERFTPSEGVLLNPPQEGEVNMSPDAQLSED